MMDVESSPVDVLTSGTDADVEMHDGTAQDYSTVIVDVEMEDLDTTPDILLDEITAGIAALHLTDKNEDYGIDKLPEHMGALSIDDDKNIGDSTMETDVTMLVQSPLPAAPPLPVAGPDDIRHFDVDTFEDDIHALAQSTAMVTLNESSPDNGPTNSQDTDELPPTPTRTLSGGTRNNTPEVEATGTECGLLVNLEALAPVHEVPLLTDGVKNLGLDVSTEAILLLEDGEVDEHDSPSECVLPSLSVEDEDWDNLNPMQMLVPEEEDDERDAGGSSCAVKNPIDEDEENLFWNGPPSGTLEGNGQYTSAVDLRQCWSDEEVLDLKNIVALRRGAISALVFSLDIEDSEDEDYSRPSSPTPCNLNVEWRLPVVRKRVRSQRDDSDEEFCSSSPSTHRDVRRGDLRNGKRIRLSE